MSDQMKRTVLYDYHLKLKANMINFSGTLLPIYYTSIQEEHKAVRQHLGIFDVSHMGNLFLTFTNFQQAIDFFNYLLTNNYSRIYPGKCIYSTMLQPDGTIIDDVIVQCLTETRFQIIVNAANIVKDYQWIHNQITDPSITLSNQSDHLSILAIQGPQAENFLAREFKFPVSDLKSFNVKIIPYNDYDIIISRTGYTGEDGFELVIDNQAITALFEQILTKGKNYHLIPCGLGARDTLRLEAALPLYGHELDNEHSPLQTNMAWSVKLNKSDFIGKSAIINETKTRFKDVLFGFEVIGRSIPRNKMSILNKKQLEIGYVTSGSYSPTLNKNIGLGYIHPEYLNDPELFINIRNKIESIKKMDLPFYHRKS